MPSHCLHYANHMPTQLCMATCCLIFEHSPSYVYITTHTHVHTCNLHNQTHCRELLLQGAIILVTALKLSDHNLISHPISSLQHCEVLCFSKHEIGDPSFHTPLLSKTPCMGPHMCSNFVCRPGSVKTTWALLWPWVITNFISCSLNCCIWFWCLCSRFNWWWWVLCKSPRCHPCCT